MKKFYFLFTALILSQNLFAVVKEWTGATNTDWATSSNWKPSGVPTAADYVTIPNVPNQPIILSGTMANCLLIEIGKSSLTINSGGSLNVVTDVATSARGISIGSNGILTNNGTLTINTNTNVNLIVLHDNTTFNNSGTVVLSTLLSGILLGGPNSIVNNTASGILNIQNGRGLNCLNGTTGNIINNQGAINYNGGGLMLSLEKNFTFNNSGAVIITKGPGISVAGGTVNNLACGKIISSSSNGNIDNSAIGSLTNNEGLIISEYLSNKNGTFTNTGVLKYTSLIGTVTSNQNNSLIVNNTEPIFTYGGTYDGKINGIFTDSLATVSAGKFEALNTFTPLATLPKGFQKLYIKITPLGGACSYIIPFTYKNWMGTPTQEIAINIAELQQNCPNPFSETTTITFNLLQNEKATLSVFDINGRQIYTSDKTFNIGHNEIVLDKNIFKNTGIYFYRLTLGTYSIAKRMQFVAK